MTSLFYCFAAAAKPDEESEVLATSPSGAFTIESKSPDPSAADAMADMWVVATKDPAQRAQLPKQSADSPPDDEFHFSPDEQWLFASRHVGSGLRSGSVYHLMSPLRIEAAGAPASFNDLAWEKCVKLGALKTNYGAMGFYAMTAFRSWSLDSARVLIRLCGGEEKRNMKCGFLYFNTRSNEFEITDYSRKLNKAKGELLACAEPIVALPSETELKKRFDTLDRQLNKRYAEVLADSDKAHLSALRQSQREWLKQRDAGEKVYLESFPATERTRRRFQYLGDVTAARAELAPDDWQL